MHLKDGQNHQKDLLYHLSIPQPHWRCLVVLLSLLPPIQREEFRVDGRVKSNIEHPTNTEDGQVPVIDSSTEDEFTVIDVSYGSDVEVCREKIITVNEAFDSHFHLDRTSFRIWKKSSGKSVEDLISLGCLAINTPNFTCPSQVEVLFTVNHPLIRK